MVVFGGTGDLALRKLLPALYYRHAEGQLPDAGRIIGVARQQIDRAGYLQMVEQACRTHIAPEDFDDHQWQGFARRFQYVHLDAGEAESYRPLVDCFEGVPEHRTRVFYLATSPLLFGVICHNLHGVGLVNAMARVVLEKPLGHDLASSCEINDRVGEVFEEYQVYRIDHYLGKETVQNLLVLRFGNAMFEPLWRSGLIDHVQITVAEQVGVEGRGDYYDRAGALRDMVQNHLLQLLCLVAMEPPTSLTPDAVRDEKLKVLRALRPLAGESVVTHTVRGQYRAGAINGQPVPGYLEEPGIAPARGTETFVALKLFIDNWRWGGVPFYLRTGKRLQSRTSEIVLNFKPVPHSIFQEGSGGLADNRLVLRLQPEEGVKLDMMAKAPGPGMQLKPVHLNLDFAQTFQGRLPGAYERLLIDVIVGRPTLFMRRDELEAAWAWVEPIMAAWTARSDSPKSYNAGTWGPTSSIALVERDGFTWHEEG
ncbi:MAG: glucose-6-phosphate dehydrogenase [Gammaproteobacteria bacterium]|nr:glucose-6-phosphate dehydrogenase [Gammaproteobacteria bacterium]